MLRQPLFSVFLSDSDEEKSEITFGAIKEEMRSFREVELCCVSLHDDLVQEHMASELYWVDVVGDAGYWQAVPLRAEVGRCILCITLVCAWHGLSGGDPGHLPRRASTVPEFGLLSWGS